MQPTQQLFVERFAAAVNAAPGEFDESTPLVEANWDSLAVMAAIALIDELFGIVVPAQQLMDCRTIAEILGVVDAQRRSGQATS